MAETYIEYPVVLRWAAFTILHRTREVL